MFYPSSTRSLTSNALQVTERGPLGRRLAHPVDQNRNAVRLILLPETAGGWRRCSTENVTLELMIARIPSRHVHALLAGFDDQGEDGHPESVDRIVIRVAAD